MLKDYKNVEPRTMAIKPISVLNVGKKNMFLSPVNADYVHLVVQKQQTNGRIG